MDVGCQTCGQLNPRDARECQYCGAVLPTPPPAARPARTGQGQAPRAHQGQAPRANQGQGPRANPWGGQISTRRRHGLKDPNAGLVVELLPGLCFFLGIGHMWAGEVALGIFLLVGYWFTLCTLIFLTVITFGLLLCVFPLYLIVWPGVPIASAIILQRRLLRERQQLVSASAVTYPH
jgi:hypothetical protein